MAPNLTIYIFVNFREESMYLSIFFKNEGHISSWNESSSKKLPREKSLKKIHL